MKLVTHPSITRQASTPRGADPLVIWLDRLVELRIPRGTRLEQVAAVIRKRFRLAPAEARKVAAFWFTIGERHLAKQHRQPWPKNVARRVQPGRRYARPAAGQ